MLTYSYHLKSVHEWIIIIQKNGVHACNHGPAFHARKNCLLAPYNCFPFNRPFENRTYEAFVNELLTYP